MMTENLAAFFDLDDFAIEGLWSGSGHNERVIMQDPAQSAEVGLVGVGSSRPVATGKAADFAGVARGQTLTIAEVAYTIADVRFTGDGLVDLVLEAP